MLLASIIMDVKPYKTKIKDFAHLATAPSGPGTERSSKLSQRDGIPMKSDRTLAPLMIRTLEKTRA